jgi:hypothetical protein
MKYMIMKKTIFILTIAFFIMSCKKNSDDFTSYIKGKLDGVAFECTTNISANKPNPIPGQGSDPTIIITGDWPMYSLKLNIYGEGSNITTGSYVFQADKNRSATLWYNGVDAYYAGNGSMFLPPQLHGSGRITIMEISEKFIKGTFEFISEVNGSTMLSKTVSEGGFYIKRS